MENYFIDNNLLKIKKLQFTTYLRYLRQFFVKHSKNLIIEGMVENNLETFIKGGGCGGPFWPYK